MLRLVQKETMKVEAEAAEQEDSPEVIPSPNAGKAGGIRSVRAALPVRVRAVPWEHHQVLPEDLHHHHGHRPDRWQEHHPDRRRVPVQGDITEDRREVLRDHARGHSRVLVRDMQQATMQPVHPGKGVRESRIPEEGHRIHSSLARNRSSPVRRKRKQRAEAVPKEAAPEYSKSLQLL